MHTVEVIKNLFIQFGAGWVLWLLFALSAGSVAVAVERWLFFRSKQDDVRALAAELDAHLASGSTGAALEALRALRSVAACVVRAGLRLAPRGPAAAEKGMQSAMSAERKQLEARLAYLGTLGNNAPFIGLFGTVIGVVEAFEQLGKQSTVVGKAAAAGAPQEVMAAIAEALVATAVGLAVAIPAVAAYNYYQRLSKSVLANTSALSHVLLSYLVAPTAPVLAAPKADKGKAGKSAPSDTEEEA